MSILAPFWHPLGLHLGTQIVKNAAPLIDPSRPESELIAQRSQGCPQTPKINQKWTNLEPQDATQDP